MIYFNKIALVLSLYLLAACTTVTTGPTLPNVPTVGAANNAGGTYTIVTDGVTHTMTGALSAGGTSLIWNGTAVADTMKGSGYVSADVLALAAMNINGANETFAGITGTTSAVPTSGTAAYDTSIKMQLLQPPFVASYIFTMPITVDFGASTLSGSGAYTSAVQGDIVGSAFTGTFSTLGGGVNSTVTTVPMQGGFYGTNGSAIVGVFAGDGLAGTFGGPVTP